MPGFTQHLASPAQCSNTMQLGGMHVRNHSVHLLLCDAQAGRRKTLIARSQRLQLSDHAARCFFMNATSRSYAALTSASGGAAAPIAADRGAGACECQVVIATRASGRESERATTELHAGGTCDMARF